MNYKIALSAAFTAAVGLTGCDSNNYTARDAGPIESGATSAGVSANAPTNVNNTRGTGTQEGDYANVNADREKEMTQRKVNPNHTDAAKAEHQPIASGKGYGDNQIEEAKENKKARPATSGTTSGSLETDEEPIRDTGNAAETSDDVASNDPSLSSPNPGVVEDQSDVYHSNGDDIASGSTSEASEPKVEYSRTEYPGGIAPEDRNLRYGLIGNGTGIGMEDATSKFLTDNDTLADPKLNNVAHSRGALSAPTDDQDALKDIKSGSSYEQYDVED